MSILQINRRQTIPKLPSVFSKQFKVYDNTEKVVKNDRI